MSYNERVEIITNQQEEYNPETGEYTSNEGERLIVPVHVMDLGVDKQVAVFGEYKRGSKVVYFQNTPKVSFRVFYLEKDNSVE